MTGLQNTSTDTMFAPLSSASSKDGRADGKSADASKNGEELTADMFANMFGLLEHADINTGAPEALILTNVPELNIAELANVPELNVTQLANVPALNVTETEISVDDLAITRSLLENTESPGHVPELSENSPQIETQTIPTQNTQIPAEELIVPSVAAVPKSEIPQPLDIPLVQDTDLAIGSKLTSKPEPELDHLINTTKAAPVIKAPLALAGVPETVKTAHTPHLPLQIVPITPTSTPIVDANGNAAMVQEAPLTAPLSSSLTSAEATIVVPISEQLIISESLPQTSSQNIQTEEAPKTAQTAPSLPTVSAEQSNTGADTSPKQDQTPQPPIPQKSEMAALTSNTIVDTNPISAEFRATESAPITASTLTSKTALTPPPQITTHVAVQQVGNAIIQRGDKGGDIVLRLDPAELGRVEISFTFDKTKGVTANVVAETASTAAVLRERADILSAQLKQSGFENINLSFDTREDGQPGKGFGAQFSDQHRTDQNAQQQTKFFDIIGHEEQGAATSAVNTPAVHVSNSDAIDIKL